MNMTANINPHYTIGTAARLSGFSTHQLRKWESRLGLLIPERTPNGRRIYTVEQIQRLKMLRRLINTGYRIGDLAKIGEDQWYTLDPELGQHAECLPLDVHVIGPMICAVLEANRNDIPGYMKLHLDKTRFSGRSQSSLPETSIIVAEIGKVTSDEAQRLVGIQKSGVHVLIIFKACEPAYLTELINSGIICLKAPVPPIALIQQLKVFFKPRGRTSTEAIPQRRFSDEVLSRTASMSQALKCECPQHIADLITKISSLEEYTLACQITSPADQNLHEELRVVASNARVLFEGALEQIADAEGLDLSETLH